MTENANALPPADWYADPRDASLQRYWNGQSWTAETRPVPGSEPAAAPRAAEPQPAQGPVASRAQTPQSQEPAAQVQEPTAQSQEPTAAAAGPAGARTPGMLGGGVGGAGGGLAGFAGGAQQSPADATGTTAADEAEASAALDALQRSGLQQGGLGQGGLGQGGLGQGGMGQRGGAAEPTPAAETVSASGPEASSVLVVTTGDIAGRAVERVLGDVCGVAVRDPGSEADQRTAVASRRLAVERLQQEALAAGANAVVGMRFDSAPAVGGGSEVAAYGTAVVASPA